MTSEKKFKIAKQITKIAVTSSTAFTTSALVAQNVAVANPLQRVQVFIGAFAVSQMAAHKTWDHMEQQIDEIRAAMQSDIPEPVIHFN